MTKTKIALATLFALGFATQAFADDSGINQVNQRYATVAQQQQHAGAEAYAYAPTQHAGFTVAERNEFDRATEAALSK